MKNKFMQFIKKNRKAIILMSVMTILNIGMVTIRLYDLKISLHSKRVILLFGLMLLLTVAMGVIFYLARRKDWKIEKVYLISGLILGIFYAICLPAANVPDEYTHFRRIYEITEGHIIQETNGTITGSELPVNIDEIIREYSGEHAYRNERVNWSVRPSSEKEFKESTNYAIFNYIPQTIGIGIGRILDLPLIPMLLLGRAFNVVCCVIIIYLCIKYIPMMKKMLFLVALFPMVMQMFASVSADGSIICAGIALITYVLYARKGMKRKLKIWDFLLLLLICLTLTVTKPAYAFLCPIVFWIPKERFKNTKHKLIFIGILGTLTLLFVLARMATFSINNGRYGANTNTNQIDLILHEPWLFLWVLFRELIKRTTFYINSTIGLSLGAFNINIFEPYIMIIMGLFAFLCAERESKISKSLKIFAGIAFTMVMVGTFGIIFMTWSIPGRDLIDGVQGRYFLPVIMLIPMLFLPISEKVRKRELVKPEFLCITMTLINVYSVAIIMATHMG